MTNAIFLHRESASSLVTKIWALGFLLEPFLYFVLIDRTSAGITINVARVLQLFVLIILVMHISMGKKITLPKYSYKLFKPIFLFTVIAVLHSIILGFLGGTMNISLVDDFSNIATFLNNIYVRPYVEILILIYQLVYFVVLPSVFLKRKADFDFLFRAAFILLVLHFVLGWIDYLLVPYQFDLLGRHFHDGVHVGQRFHGLAGEPRDAAVLMLSFFFFFAIHSVYKHKQVRSISLPIIILVIISWIATNSFSGILALIFAFILYFVYGPKIVTTKAIIKLSCYMVLLAMLVIGPLYFSERLFNYMSVYSTQISKLFFDPFIELPSRILASFNNVFPIIMMSEELKSGNFLPLLFGYGLGTSGQVNALIYSEFSNPNSQIIRSIYEFGLIGTSLFISSILYTVRSAAHNLSVVSKKRMVIFLIIALGAFFAHRGYFIFMWVGLLVSVINFRFNSIRL